MQQEKLFIAFLQDAGVERQACALKLAFNAIRAMERVQESLMDI